MKKWTYGADGTPQKIYYKRPASYNSADTIYITLSVNNTTMIQKQLMFNDVSVAHLKYIDSPMTGTGNIKGFWTHNIGVYPDREWEIDENEDWINSDVIGYTGGDKNRPFVFHTGDQFSLEKAAFKAVGNSNLSSYGYGVNVRMYDYLGTGLIGNANNSGEYEADLEHDIGPGDTMSVINSETVCVNLTVGLDTFRTKHKVYTIGGSLTGDNNYHTLIDLGCEAAKGLMPFEKDEIFSRIFGKYATLDIRRIDGGAPITYWKNGADNTNSTGDVLQTRNGRCGTWAEMFNKTLSLQGVTGGTQSFALKRNLWVNFPYAYNGCALYGYFNGEYYGIQLLQEATAYQGGSDSHPELANFIDHEINTYSGKYYDVTCGWGPYDSLNDYFEDAVYFRIFRISDGQTIQINHFLDSSDFSFSLL
ncbi:MAG: hypothetical protein IK083_03935 [Abditibacteriota bacterium]|nr:hypothetical protein [Abditibacteriota bacterium]